MHFNEKNVKFSRKVLTLNNECVLLRMHSYIFHVILYVLNIIGKPVERQRHKAKGPKGIFLWQPVAVGTIRYTPDECFVLAAALWRLFLFLR